VTALLEAIGLSAGYHKVPVVHEIDLRVGAGEVVVLLGPNGAGKTTTLLSLAGELPLLGGRVELFGSPAADRLHKRARRGLAYLPEGRPVFGGLSVGDNLRLGLGPVADALNHGDELRVLLRRRAGLLSGGQQQILGLSRALASEPRLILADELSLGLAPTVTKRMLREVRSAADRGAGVLLVEQHAHQALTVADRGYVLRRGRVVLSGSAAELSANIDELHASYLTGIES
jgi:branched-chain amino acid transport system ATP-binding protein